MLTLGLVLLRFLHTPLVIVDLIEHIQHHEHQCHYNKIQHSHLIFNYYYQNLCSTVDLLLLHEVHELLLPLLPLLDYLRNLQILQDYLVRVVLLQRHVHRLLFHWLYLSPYIPE